MHELGHDLGLQHGGANSDNCKPNYMSVMNYDHFLIQRLDGSSVIDYSPPRPGVACARRARRTWPRTTSAVEVLGHQSPKASSPTPMAWAKRLSLVGAPVDWNGDGDTADSMITVNIDTSDGDSLGARTAPSNH
jgi:hypothetical protein